MLKLSFPYIRLVNKELKDPSFYLDEDFDLENLDFEFSIKPYDKFNQGIVFFIHLLIRHIDDQKESTKILHFDYILVFNTEVEIEINRIIEIKKNELAQLLGASILMVRGSIMTILQDHPLERFQLPIQNPMEILEKNLEVKDGNFIFIVDE